MALEIPPAPSAGLAVDRTPPARLAGLALEIPPALSAGLAVDRTPPARLAGLADAATASGCCASRHGERGVVELAAPEGVPDRDCLKHSLTL